MHPAQAPRSDQHNVPGQLLDSERGTAFPACVLKMRTWELLPPPGCGTQGRDYVRNGVPLRMVPRFSRVQFKKGWVRAACAVQEVTWGLRAAFPSSGKGGGREGGRCPSVGVAG